MITQYFSFMQKQFDLRNKYVIIHGKDPFDCRGKMFKKYGNQWAFQYDSAEDIGVEEFGLTLLEEIQ